MTGGAAGPEFVALTGFLGTGKTTLLRDFLERPDTADTAVIVNEVGLFGGVAVLIIGLLFAARGFKTATLATDGFAKLLATGLSAVFAIQIFVIVGGVTRVIPLTGVTLPFVSYGGSSIVANMVLLALLLIVSDHARAERLRRGGLV